MGTLENPQQRDNQLASPVGPGVFHQDTHSGWHCSQDGSLRWTQGYHASARPSQELHSSNTQETLLECKLVECDQFRDKFEFGLINWKDLQNFRNWTIIRNETFHCTFNRMPPQTEHCIFMMERKQEPKGGRSLKGEIAPQWCRGLKWGQKTANTTQ